MFVPLRNIAALIERAIRTRGVLERPGHRSIIGSANSVIAAIVIGVVDVENAALVFAEAFGSRFRDDLLNREVFTGLEDARWVVDRW